MEPPFGGVFRCVYDLQQVACRREGLTVRMDVSGGCSRSTSEAALQAPNGARPPGVGMCLITTERSMVGVSTLLSYSLVVLGLFLIPGPAVLLTLARSMSGGALSAASASIP